ncbi:hypothetical protein SAMN04487866_101116 [Thermoactinomyces sp. DSM 45891]|uniref:hypothetical protein n=1 Tax=Thermoactinomyces sp. DSM 45891 TaxID=1761907 RepID=UPI00091186C3|nr:hypothetical protein [Thermoactinomyces sp. DSM 45891]SFW99549.1 hypothetical protein SAMN04487866_101116 [Thermoactinomyces sp. DSM 45891]
MKNKWFSIIMQSCLVTTIAINLMLVAMFLWVPKANSVPATASPSQSGAKNEYTSELQNRQDKGSYQVEAYQEYEITRDASGNIIKKEATDETTYLRYWNGDNPTESAE